MIVGADAETFALIMERAPTLSHTTCNSIFSEEEKENKDIVKKYDQDISICSDKEEKKITLSHRREARLGLQGHQCSQIIVIIHTWAGCSAPEDLE